ncbi:RlmE family RNA methyltransferase [Candidatus Phycosocius spiralis]|uniref:Ribosomal RNA large subunit methyltransferase E n=1 Tax=Candidatus Phycosocius spiralis TaxID=2815099 RepID=A0ABQ4PST2_9PROT|nr:RlmE family RNA methyltransferase [Candidatus Phycosocius spiralis]GIU66020.1 ribosomal RNA large subunit methyltransferase E [Candidatus Phycosocius spiralis]
MRDGKNNGKWAKKGPPSPLPERRRRIVFDMGETDARATPARVKTGKGRSAQSTRWLERQLNDPYVHRAKADGWRARSAYKLLELNEKFHFIPHQGRVIDLGAAPGGWSQVVARRGAAALVGIDLLPMDPIEGATLIQADFLAEGMQDHLLDLLGGCPDLVISDMAANTVGHKQTDHLRTAALSEAAALFAMRVLAPGGAFVTKMFQGGTEAHILSLLKQSFREVRHAKPPSSRAESVELFMVAKGFKTRNKG